MKISKSQLRLLKSLRVLLLLISVSSFSLATYFLWARYYNPARLNFASLPKVVPQASPQILSGLSPVRLSIPSLKIDLPVTSSDIVNGNWTVTTSGVSHLSQSVSPGLPGNSIFYGHNWQSLLGSLHKIQLQDQIIVSDSTGRSLVFKVSKITKVDPTDVSILDSTTEPTLTLYTCTDFMDTKRLVVIGHL